MAYATQRKRVVSTALLNRTVVYNPKGFRLTYEGAEVLFLKIFRGKPYSIIVEASTIIGPIVFKKLSKSVSCADRCFETSRCKWRNLSFW